MSNPKKRSCLAWLIHMEWGLFECQLWKNEDVLPLHVHLRMVHHLAKCMVAGAACILQIMQTHLVLVTVVSAKAINALTGNKVIFS